jgi:hypothetical protein
MKSIYLTVILLLIINSSIKAQWQQNGNRIFYNDGYVGIGTSFPSYFLDIEKSTIGQTENRIFMHLNNKSTDYASSIGIKLTAGSNEQFYTMLTIQSPYYTPCSGRYRNMGTLVNNGAGLALRADSVLRLETKWNTGIGAHEIRMLIDISGNVGINTTQPQAKLDVNGDILISDTHSGLILTSPDGNKWKISVDNDGHLITSSLVTKIEEFSRNPLISIYPNPTNQKLLIDLMKSEIQFVDIEVYDISGKMVFMKNYKGTLIELDINDFNSGTYIIRVKDLNGNILHADKIIKE